MCLVTAIRVYCPRVSCSSSDPLVLGDQFSREVMNWKKNLELWLLAYGEKMVAVDTSPNGLLNAVVSSSCIRVIRYSTPRARPLRAPHSHKQHSISHSSDHHQNKILRDRNHFLHFFLVRNDKILLTYRRLQTQHGIKPWNRELPTVRNNDRNCAGR